MEIDDLMAYCGLVCGSCSIYVATREADKEKQAETRKQIVEFASKYYGTDIKPEDITDCDGCRTPSGRLYSGCSKCDIRGCAKKKGCLTCAHCPEYTCDKLQKLFVSDPNAKSRIDGVRSSL